jgi:phosphomannomutase/phosphoglucomutase
MLIAMDDAECRTFVHQFIDQTDFEQGQITLIDGIRVDFSNGWGLVRASNTVPGLSMRFEAATDSDLTQIKQLFKAKILKIKPSLKLPF